MFSMAKQGDKDSLKWYQRVALELLWTVCRGISLLPRWARFYVIRPIFYVILVVLRYRRGVILNNIKNSFPELTMAECKRIMYRYYNNLAEVIVCTISLAGATKEDDDDMFLWLNAEEHMERTRGRDWVAMAAHFGCWEYFPLWSRRDPACCFLCVYHPLHSPVFEHFYHRLRAFAPNLLQVPMKETLRYYLRNRVEGRSTVLGLASDQSPVLHADTEWLRFLNQDTAFVQGGEKLALRFHIPVYFLHIRRTAPGQYEGTLNEIYDGVEAVEDGVITRRYADSLERMIREAPELWMWSHRRWKHTPEKQAARFGIHKKVAK